MEGAEQNSVWRALRFAPLGDACGAVKVQEEKRCRRGLERWVGRRAVEVHMAHHYMCIHRPESTALSESPTALLSSE